MYLLYKTYLSGGPLTLSLEEQLEHFDRKAPQAFVRCLRDLKANKEQIIEEARRRLIEGFGPYGRTMFRASFDELSKAEIEKQADAINRRLARMYQGWT